MNEGRKVAHPEKWAAERIIEMLEQGNLPAWRKTWKGENNLPKNIRGNVYKGMNRWLLLMAPYGSSYYLTPKQITDLGGYIRKGERSWPVFFWSPPKDDEEKKSFWFCKGYKVFNVEQTEGIDAKRLPKAEVIDEHTHNPIDECERLIAEYPNIPVISHGGDRACYAPISDAICMPKKEHFGESTEYYATLFHELGHATGHKSRCDRESLQTFKAFGDHVYSQEELVAEFYSAMMASKAGIDMPALIENSASYIKSWHEKLKKSPEILVYAIKDAEKAFQWSAKKEEGKEEVAA